MSFIKMLPFTHHPFKLFNHSGTIAIRHSGFVPLLRMSLVVFLLKRKGSHKRSLVEKYGMTVLILNRIIFQKPLTVTRIIRIVGRFVCVQRPYRVHLIICKPKIKNIQI